MYNSEGGRFPHYTRTSTATLSHEHTGAHTIHHNVKQAVVTYIACVAVVEDHGPLVKDTLYDITHIYYQLCSRVGTIFNMKQHIMEFVYRTQRNITDSQCKVTDTLRVE